MDGPSRRLYTLVSVVVLILSLWGFRGQLRLAAIPETTPRLELPVQVEGVSAHTAEEFRFLAEGYLPGTTVRVSDASGSVTPVILHRAHTRAYLIVTLFSGLCFLGVAAFVLAPRVGGEAPRDFFWSTILYGLAIMIGGVYFPKPPLWPDLVRGMLQLASLAALPVLFLHLVLVFPRRSARLDRHRFLMPLLWFAAAAVFAAQGVAFLRYFAVPGPERARLLALTQNLADGLLVVLVGTAVIVLFLRSRRLELTRERNQTKWLLWGFTLGITPYVFLRTLPQLLGMNPPVGAALDRVFELAIPAAFVLAVVKYHFLDIDIIIRRSLIYGILAAALILTYLGLALTTGGQLTTRDTNVTRVFLIGAGLLAGMGFLPLRALIGRWVDRTFFKITHDFETAYELWQPRLESSASRIESAGLLADFLDEQLGPHRVEVAVRAGEDVVTLRGTEPAVAARWLDEVRLAGAGEILAAPGSTSLPELEATGFPEGPGAEGFVLAQTLGVEGRMSGCVFLGEKRSERLYIETDLRLLSMVGAAASTVLRRIELVQAVDAEAQERRRLNEMTRLKNQFLSQAAHDLRTPVASISWSTANLLDGIVGAVSEPQQEYLQSIKASSDALNRMVSNLFEISLLEQGMPSLNPQAVDLCAVLSRSVKTIRPLAAEKTVELRMGEGTAEAVVHADPEKLFQVAMNLLDNAVKYSPPGSAVEISVSSLDGDTRAFSVRDHGPGVKDAGDRSLFERFRQSAASPYSQKHGFGLGLFIVRSFLELMGGSVEVDNHPDGGAVFTCRLPVSAPRPRENE